ncbi:MAG: ribonuclease P protein component [Patescibacteria group bacterium]
MLPRKFKIGNKARIEYIIKKGRRINGKFFQLRGLPSRMPHLRFSVIVSGKISKKAVERNFIRRRIYEAIHTGVLSPKCYDIVVLVSRKIIDADWDEIKEETARGLQQL